MAAASAEETILRREVNKKRLKPLRKLFGEIPEKVARYEALAEELSLLATGGSDFHRPNGDERELGCAKLTEEAFERLRAAAT